MLANISRKLSEMHARRGFFELLISCRQRECLAFLALFLSCVGCGLGGPKRPGTQEVEGKLTLDGAPFGPALVTLTPTHAGGFSVAGEADAQGKLTFTTNKKGDGAPVGEYKVTLPPDPLGRAPKPIPLVYQKADSTPLTVKIEAKKNSVQIALESKVKDAATPGAGYIGGGKTKTGPQHPPIDPKLMPKTNP